MRVFFILQKTLDKQKISIGFTLIELIVVLVMIGILSAFSVGQYQDLRRKTQDREAKAMLVIIQAAEKMRKLETNYYIGCNGNSNCNKHLELDISSSNWTYSVDITLTTFCAQATGGGTKNWHIGRDDKEPQEKACP